MVDVFPLCAVVQPVNPVLIACLLTMYLVFYTLLSLQPVSLSVNKRQGFPPLTVQAEIRIPRHSENREACVTLHGPIEDQSCWELTIDSSPVFTRKWSGLWGGNYIAQARLLRGRETLFSQAVSITVAEDP